MPVAYELDSHEVALFTVSDVLFNSKSDLEAQTYTVQLDTSFFSCTKYTYDFHSLRRDFRSFIIW